VPCSLDFRSGARSRTSNWNDLEPISCSPQAKFPKSLKNDPGSVIASEKPGSRSDKSRWRYKLGMNELFMRFWVALKSLQSNETGQDLVEYALLVCLIALAALAGVRHVATAVTAVFSNISSSLN
jgi:pilus assembly protein Flp/PilA